MSLLGQIKAAADGPKVIEMYGWQNADDESVMAFCKHAADKISHFTHVGVIKRVNEGNFFRQSYFFFSFFLCGSVCKKLSRALEINRPTISKSN
jgi:hypothetical protein